MSASDAPEPVNSGPAGAVSQPVQGFIEERVSDGGSRKSSGYLKWIAIGLVGLLAVGVGIWFLFDNSKKRDVPD